LSEKKKIKKEKRDTKNQMKTINQQQSLHVIEIPTVSVTTDGQEQQFIQSSDESIAVSVNPVEVMNKIFDTALLGKEAKNALNQHQINSYTEVVKSNEFGATIREAVVFGNASGFNHSEFPTGQMIKYAADSYVDPMTLRPDSIKCTVVCPIYPQKGQRFNDKFFLDKLQDLQNGIEQYSSNPITLMHRDEDNKDNDYWKPEMGSSGSVGIQKKQRGARNWDYFVYASASTDVLGQQVINEVIDAKKQGNPMTWRTFAESESKKYWENKVLANVARLARQVAEKLKVSIDTTEEYGTYTETDDQAPHLIAQTKFAPAIEQYISSIDIQYGGRRGPVVAQYSQCTPVDLCRNNVCLVAVSPFRGFVGVKLDDGFAPTKGALPTTTGRKVHSTNLDFQNGISEEDFEDIANQYTWDGKPEKLSKKDIHDKIHPGAYRGFSDEFVENNFLSQGTVKRNIDNYIPVIAKISVSKPRPVLSASISN